MKNSPAENQPPGEIHYQERSADKGRYPQQPVAWHLRIPGQQQPGSRERNESEADGHEPPNSYHRPDTRRSLLQDILRKAKQTAGQHTAPPKARGRTTSGHAFQAYQQHLSRHYCPGDPTQASILHICSKDNLDNPNSPPYLSTELDYIHEKR